MTTEPTLRLLSLGAGVQSTTLLLLAAERRIGPLDGAIFADTGWEPASVYAHLDRLEREVAQPAGIPIYRVSAGRIQDDVLDPDKQRSLPAHTIDPATGDRGMLNRRCTQTYKLTPILRQVRLLLGAATSDPRPCRYCDGTGTRIAPWRAKRGDHVPGPCSVCGGVGSLARVGQPPRDRWAEQWIGFSADEIGRVSTRADTRYSRSRHPLLDLGMSRVQCEAYLRSKGWGSTAKSACIGCPFHGNAEWRRMRDTDPDSWVEAIRFDAAYRTGPGLRHQRYLHISRKPLAEAPIDRIRPSEYQQTTVFDQVYETELERAEMGDPDGCSPWACRSGEPVARELGAG
ncbi:hypothetical protein RM844_30485 [Streptomyces sp. DSM 44915]|uniref:Phosphoadenosine phosphosulfate reductase n=1 Tax=Streptomyces chisholmiae TaxID=3075540 RepID=A0ABU2K0U4_9ACTN|nr:hypothetical protein [Streptomyces sp. DSM 44915]MDT0270609.1 hypothetical protein [Streptomyces sp. DSM 44915]